MKRKILSILLTLGILVGLMVAATVPVAAASHWVLYGTIGGEYLVTIDETTGEATLALTLVSDGYSVGKIAFDSTTGTLYGLARYGTSHTPYLATIDIVTGVVNVIGPITLPGCTVYFAEGLAIDPSGTIYVSMSINGDYPPDYYSESLVTVVDPSTAVATKVGNIDPTTQNEADGLEFVGTTLYATDDPGSGPTYIYTISTTTAGATLMGQLTSPRFNNVGDMAYNPSTDKLYGFDPGAYTTGNPRCLCTINQPGAAVATCIGITHTSDEFEGKLMGGIAWVFINTPPVADPNGPYLQAAGTDINFDGSASYDPDGDDLTYSWDFGDSNSGSGPNPTHAYDEPGIYDVCLTVIDPYGASDTECTFAVVYGPGTGFVTGGGWIESPQGAYTADPTLVGRANFGFVSKYNKKTGSPDGNTEFQFKAGDLNFHSDSYEWLLVANHKAMYKGTGTINGQGSYGFMLTAIDAHLTPSTDVDLFRIKIWDKDNGDVIVYDNQVGETDDYADPTTAIGGGSIVIHAK